MEKIWVMRCFNSRFVTKSNEAQFLTSAAAIGQSRSGISHPMQNFLSHIVTLCFFLKFVSRSNNLFVCLFELGLYSKYGTALLTTDPLYRTGWHKAIKNQLLFILFTA